MGTAPSSADTFLVSSLRYWAPGPAIASSCPVVTRGVASSTAPLSRGASPTALWKPCSSSDLDLVAVAILALKESVTSCR